MPQPLMIITEYMADA